METTRATVDFDSVAKLVAQWCKGVPEADKLFVGTGNGLTDQEKQEMFADEVALGTANN